MANYREISAGDITHNWRFIATVMAIFASITFFASTLITPEYEGETKILILQKNQSEDAYRAAKSSEFAAEVLQSVIGSFDFANGIMNRAGGSLQEFGSSPEDQIKNWNDAVEVSTEVNTGIIKISVYQKSVREDRRLMNALISELLENGVNYHGNENITLKKISGPVYFDSPAYPIIWLNVLVAGVVGFFFSVGIVFFSQKGVNEWFGNNDSQRIGGTFHYDPADYRTEVR